MMTESLSGTIVTAAMTATEITTMMIFTLYPFEWLTICSSFSATSTSSHLQASHLILEFLVLLL